MILLLAVWPQAFLRGDEPPQKAELPKKTVRPDHVERVKAGTALFKSEVRQLLSQHCLKCHGGESIKGDFDLSSFEALEKSGMIGEDAASSHLFSLITHADEPHMPKDAAKLPDAALAKIERWLNLGAPYDQPLVTRGAGDDNRPAGVTAAERDFWSFRPLAAAEPPQVANPSWARTPIDAFILKQLEGRQLQPNAAADRRTLVRRAYLDLLGLPPTPEQVDAFVHDTDPSAYEKLIDTLLESPHYGERWARHWMDIARYAESHGYEQDYDRPNAYPYRDFLIQALNADMPYDQFLQWQIAGDELAPEDPLALMATGFLGAGAFPTQLTEVEFESARYDELDDIAATLGTSMLGLSIGCARCHAHKFDPIPAADYYQFIASFTTTIRSEIDLDLDPEGNRARREKHDGELAQLRAELERYEREELPPAMQAWLAKQDLDRPSDGWALLQIESITSSGGTKYEQLPDGSWLAQGEAPAKETITLIGAISLPQVAALRLETLADDSLPHRGPGRAANGNFALGDVRVALLPKDAEPQALKLVAARATHQQNEGSLSVAASLDADPTSGWAVDQGGIGKDQAAVFDLEASTEIPAGAKLRLELVCQHPNTRHSPGRLRVAAATLPELPATPGQPTLDGKVREALVALKQSFAQDSEAYRTAQAWFATTLPAYRAKLQAVEALQKAGPQLQLTKAQITSEGFPHMKHHADDRGFPHFYPETYVLTRGDVHQKKEVATPSYLQVLMRNGYGPEHWQVPQPEGWTRTSFRRASLANWLTDVDHGAGHLAARVIVNRLWQHHLGRGIVATPSDFGRQGEPPTHPELLDWLAHDLVTHDWKLKRLHKLIMTSAVYMQSSDSDEARVKQDPDNQLLWRFTPRRMEAEAIRDSMLYVSGLLDPTMYGPGTLDQSMRRRSIYFFIKRSQLIPMMMLFDWPEHLVGIGQRSTTTIAPQALAFMNSPQARQYAAGLASRLAALEHHEQVQQAYRLCYGRTPEPRELELAAAFLERQAAGYTAMQKENARQLALVDWCQALMSTNEFVYID